jgi:hypothetical protein
LLHGKCYVRSSLRWLALTVGCAALATMLIVYAPRLWLRTAHGHRTVERVLTHILNQRVPGVVSVGALSGDVLTGLRANDVIVRNPSGAVIGRAQYIVAHWRPLRLLRRRELEEVQVERPVIALDRGRWVSPVTDAARAGRSRDVFIQLISAHEGQASYQRVVFTRLSGTATLHSLSHLDVHGLSAHAAGNILHAFGTVGWGPRRPTWVAARFAVDRPRRIHGAGEVFYTPRRLEADIAQLTIAAPVATRLVGGRGPLRLQGHLEGAAGQLRTVAHAQQDQRTMHIRVSIDRARQEANIGARLAGTMRPIRLQGRLRYRPGTIQLSVLHAIIGHSRLDGSGWLMRRHLRAGLRMHVLPSEARLARLQPVAPIDVVLGADGPTRALAVRGQARMETAQLSWVGRVDLQHRAGVLRLFARAVQPARLVRGTPEMRISGTFDFAGQVAPHALVGSIRLADGTVDVQGNRLSHVVADSPIARLGRDGDLLVRRLVGQWRNRRFSARGRVSWSRREIAVSDAVLDYAGGHALADARYQLAERQLTVRATPLSLSPALVSRLLHRPYKQPWTGRVEITGKRDDVTIAVEAATMLGRLRVATRLHRLKRYFDLQHVEAWLGDSHLDGAIHYQGGRISTSVKELVLSPSLVHQLVPQLMPAWPIRLHGAIAGHVLLAVRAELNAGPSTARISGRIAAGQFQLVAYLDSFDLTVLRPSARRVRGSLQLAVTGRLGQGGVVGTLAIRDAHGYMLDSPFYRGVADARLEGRSFTLSRAVAQLPGARIIAKGSGGLDKSLAIEYGVVITNSLALRQVPKGLRTVIGINSILPGRSVTGSITKRPGERIKVSHHTLPIVIAQLDFLFRLITGRLSWAELRL